MYVFLHNYLIRVKKIYSALFIAFYITKQKIN